MRYIKNGTLKSILLIIIGATILSFGSYNFNYQNNVTEGGVLGLLLLLQHVFNISPSITSVVTVSYTHLVASVQDTVKGSLKLGFNRVKGTMIGGLVGFLCVLISPGNPILAGIGIMTTISVSYTHLDVYKRQMVSQGIV